MDPGQLAGELLGPLVLAAEDRAELALVLSQLGQTAGVDDAVFARVQQLLALDDLVAVADLVEGLADPDDPRENGDLLADLVPHVAAVLAAVQGLSSMSAGDVAGLAAPYDDPATWRNLAVALPEYLLGRWLDEDHPVLGAVVCLLGLTRPVDPATSGLEALDLGKVAAFLGDPGGSVAAEYGWSTGGGPSVDGVALLLARLHRLALALGFRGTLGPRVAGASDDGTRLDLVLVDGPGPGGAYVQIGLTAALLADEQGRAAGITLTLSHSGAAAAGVAVAGGWTVDLAGPGATDGVTVAVEPGEVPVLDGGSGEVELRFGGTPPVPWVLLGTAPGTRLELSGAAVSLTLGADGDLAVAVELPDALALVVEPGDADSFLASVLGAMSLTVRTGLDLRWSRDRGLAVGGSAALAVVVPVDRGIGPVYVQVFGIAVVAAGVDGSVEFTLTGSLTVGPFTVIVEELGVRAQLVAAPSGQAAGLGSADLQVGLRFPTGLGIAIDLEGILVGGGYLSLDHEIGRYAGVAQLSMLSIGVTAIGIVETQLPGDPDGWSFFLSVVAEFTPIPLGFGFTLNGVGGFMGLHRSLDADALGLGVREGRIDSVLFPDDPLLNATRILADIEEFFPSRADCYTFGLMVKIGWGAPTIITVEIGVILSVPEVIIALVGELACVLPDPAAPLLELHMGVVGVLDVAGATLSISASIYDSQLVGIALSGDMAMYLSLGTSPYFLFSVGGYAPGWKPPASVPSSMKDLSRMAAAIDFGSTLDVGLDTYFAVTPNTVQFGAEVYAAARVHEIGVDFSAEGSFGFDVQITFSPFQMVADMHAGVAIEAEGFTLLSVQLKLHLEGPQPWYGSGTAEFTFLGRDVPFHIAIGQPTVDEAPPEVDLWDDVLLPGLSDPTAWQVGGTEISNEVTLRGPDPVTEPGLWLGPQSRVEVRQRLVPLNRDIDVYGALVPDTGVARFDVAEAGLTEDEPAPWTAIEEYFAPAQYTAMSPSERLSAPSYEVMDAGVSLTATGWTVPTQEENVTSVLLGYEQTVQDGTTEEAGWTFHAMDVEAMGGLLTASAHWGALDARPVTAVRYAVTSELAGALRVGTTRYLLVDPLDAFLPHIPGPGSAHADLVTARRYGSPTGAPGTAAAPRARIVPWAAARWTFSLPHDPFDLPGPGRKEGP